MTKKQVGEIISTGRDRLAVETSELEERVQNIREYAVSGTRPTVRVLARLESALCDLRIAIQILEEEYGAWQGETGLRRPEDAHLHQQCGGAVSAGEGSTEDVHD